MTNYENINVNIELRIKLETDNGSAAEPLLVTCCFAPDNKREEQATIEPYWVTNASRSPALPLSLKLITH